MLTAHEQAAVALCAQAEVHGVVVRQKKGGGVVVGGRLAGPAVAESAVAEAEAVIGGVEDAGRKEAMESRKREVVGRLVRGCVESADARRRKDERLGMELEQLRQVIADRGKLHPGELPPQELQKCDQSL